MRVMLYNIDDPLLDRAVRDANRDISSHAGWVDYSRGVHKVLCDILQNCDTSGLEIIAAKSHGRGPYLHVIVIFPLIACLVSRRRLSNEAGPRNILPRHQFLDCAWPDSTSPVDSIVESIIILKASANCFKRFTSRLLNFFFSLSMHLLPRMNVMLDFI